MRLDQLVSELMPGALERKPRLLVVDDQTINIQVMYQAFAQDCQVFMATSGAQALQMCKDNPPDLVLLDVVMPGMDGFEVCQQLMADPLSALIPVIFVTAHSDESMETRGLNLGAVDFIFKPINPSVVRARVKTHLTLKFQSDLLRSLVFRDGLTGAFNRRFFDEQLQEEWARSGRTHSPLSLIMIDVDFFKKYNDRYGHQCGDDCLRSVAKTLQAGLKRSTDRVARYGGEEFVCILPDTSLAHAREIADHLLQAVQALQLPHASSEVAEVVTISLGVASREPKPVGDTPIPLNSPDSPETLVALADAQLYAAKSGGRARVCG